MNKTRPTLNIIAAACENMGIGKNGNLPWRLKKEMKFFQDKTSCVDRIDKQNAVIMGRKTWFSIPEKYRPLPDRINVVLTTTHPTLEGCDHVAQSLEEALIWLTSSPTCDKVDKIFIVGGQAIYQMAMDSTYDQRIYLTRIHKDFDCDTFFPVVDDSKYTLAEKQDVPQGTQEENGITYEYFVYVKNK